MLRLLVALCFACCAALSIGPLGAAGAEIVSGPLVVSDRWPQATDLTTWTRDVMRLEGVESASETERGKAFFRWLRLFNRMATGGMIQAYEGQYGKERYVLDAHKNLFVYGWGFCDTTSRIAEAAWQLYTGDAHAAQRVITQHEDGGYHTMYRLRLDGNWGAFDPRYGYYLIDRDAPDARVLDWAEVGEDANITRNKGFRHRSRPFFEFFGAEWRRAFLISRCFYAGEAEWVAAGSPVECVFADRKYETGTPFHDMDFRLLKGMTIERFWDDARHDFYVPAGAHTRREEAFLPSGRFYRVTDTMFDGNWPEHDPNYKLAEPYLTEVPLDEGYNEQVRGGRTIGQASGRIVYEPDLRDSELSAALVAGSTLIHSEQAPYLRAAADQATGSATFDLYSPYILVDGALSGELAGAPGTVKLELRVLQAKALNRSQPDLWSDWQTLVEGPGEFDVGIGRKRFNGRDASIGGAYRFQVRVTASTGSAAAGLTSLKMTASFENAIMSIPQILEGPNTIRFKVKDSSKIRGPIRVEYRFETAAGESAHEQTLTGADFHANEASYQIDASSLIRCNSLSISY